VKERSEGGVNLRGAVRAGAGVLKGHCDEKKNVDEKKATVSVFVGRGVKNTIKIFGGGDDKPKWVKGFTRIVFQRQGCRGWGKDFLWVLTTE